MEMKNKAWLTPLYDKVLLLPAFVETKTKSGLVIPDEYKERPQHGDVVALGEGCKTVKIGQDVLFGKYSGMWVENPETHEEFILIKESDLVGILNVKGTPKSVEKPGGSKE